MGVVYEEGGNVTFTCTDLGGPGNSIQWLRDDEDLTSETDNLLTLTNITVEGDGAVYTCVANNSAGMGSASVGLNISPVIDLDPTDINTDNNETVSFACNARAFPPPVYEWVRVGDLLPESVTGENTSMLTFNPVMFGDQGDYYCTATSSGITVSSNTATLTSELVYTYSFLKHLFLLPYLSPFLSFQPAPSPSLLFLLSLCLQSHQ